MPDSTLLPEYDNPPLNEVICGTTFKPLGLFTAAHVGVLWSKYQPEYPRVEEHPPVAAPIEIFTPTEVPQELEFTTVPPLPREMFISKDGTYVIQVQRDRFIFNWRRLEETNQYPRYSQVIDKFESNYKVFESLLNEMNASAEMVQYELTYNNHIPKGDLWDTVADLGDIFPFAKPRIEGAILTGPEVLNWRTSFLMPDQLGRLHVTIRTNSFRRSDRVPLIIFELTARGIPKELSEKARRDWFDLAREWIVKGFTDLTSEKAHQNLWRRTR